MTIEAKIINQPYSGQYTERIYDIQSHWNSQSWTWVKFRNDDLTEWCGEFRGSPRGIGISHKHNCILILTSDYLYKLTCFSGELIEYESQPQYQNLTVTPAGDFLIADYYGIELIKDKLNKKKTIDLPIHADGILFDKWSNNKLLIKCDEFLKWSNHIELELDCETLEVNIISES